MKLVIENKKGSVRHWKDPDGQLTRGKTYMTYDYGYVDDTTAADGEELDIYVGPCTASDKVFVIHQLKSPDFKEFDEYKCMVYFDTVEQAREAYLIQYTDPRFFGGVTTITFSEFRSWVTEHKGSNTGLGNILRARQPQLFVDTIRRSRI